MLRSEFKKLQAKWDKKLADSGFVDAEKEHVRTDPFNNLLKQGKYKKGMSPAQSREVKVLVYETTREYYSRAEEFLHSYKFENEKTEFVWSMHTIGSTVNEIVKAGTKHQLTLQMVRYWVDKLRTEMLGRKDD